jgi:hypothetical protein
VDGLIERLGATVVFHGAGGDWAWQPPITVASKLRSRRKLTIEEFSYSRGRARASESDAGQPADPLLGVVTRGFHRGLPGCIRAVRRWCGHHQGGNPGAGQARLHVRPDRLARSRHHGGPGEPGAARVAGHANRANADRGH